MKKLIILLTTLLILQGCSSKGDISTEQLQNLTNSVSISQLEKTEFSKKDNKLVISTNDEVISKEGFDALLKSLKLNGFNGKAINIEGINSNEFNNKDFNIVIVTKNNNSVTFSVKDSANKSFEISNKKYSKDFMKNNLQDTEVVIRKFQIQLQRSLGNIDILTDELNKTKNDVTSLRTRNSQYRLENDKLRQRIRELEGKIEALL